MGRTLAVPRFQILWTHTAPDIPTLKQAKAEYVKLQ